MKISYHQDTKNTKRHEEDYFCSGEPATIKEESW
jgi:hypothetical protein